MPLAVDRAEKLRWIRLEYVGIFNSPWTTGKMSEISTQRAWAGVTASYLSAYGKAPPETKQIKAAEAVQYPPFRSPMLVMVTYM